MVPGSAAGIELVELVAGTAEVGRHSVAVVGETVAAVRVVCIGSCPRD